MSFSEYLKIWRRFRTPVLAVLTTLMLVWSAVQVFDVPVAEVFSFMLICVLGVAVIMTFALAAGGLAAWLRRR